MDMLIKLYEPAPATGRTWSDEITFRKPIAPEFDLIVAWVASQFSPGWASEVRAALGNRPVSLWIALRATAIIGFCCYDATALGFVGPIGVRGSDRACGVGAVLLLNCLQDMRSLGYGYAIVGGVGAPGFFQKVAGATEIAGSTPGLYRNMMKP
jgi:hypothetical protein